MMQERDSSQGYPICGCRICTGAADWSNMASHVC